MRRMRVVHRRFVKDPKEHQPEVVDVTRSEPEATTHRLICTNNGRAISTEFKIVFHTNATWAANRHHVLTGFACPPTLYCPYTDTDSCLIEPHSSFAPGMMDPEVGDSNSDTSRCNCNLLPLSCHTLLTWDVLHCEIICSTRGLLVGELQ